MSLFQCEQCGGRENTALGSYWLKEKKLCSECHTGKWHGKFPKLILPKGMFVTNGEGNLAHKETGDTDIEKYAIKPEFNQAEFDEMVDKGTEAWGAVPNATQFVENLRGNDNLVDGAFE